MLLQTDHVRPTRSKIICLLLALAGDVLAACGSAAPLHRHSLAPATAEPPIRVRPTETRKFRDRDEPEQANLDSRPVVAVAQGATLFAETWYVDPVIRPFSTAKAYYGLVLKSAGGFLERVSIEAVRMPLLEKKPIPPLGEGPGMDLDAWEYDLDELLGNKASQGTIDYLVDGDEYFPRLTQAIIGAESSVDIRTYIFDNDDVAVQVADLLKERSHDVDVKVLVDGLLGKRAFRTQVSDFKGLLLRQAYGHDFPEQAQHLGIADWPIVSLTNCPEDLRFAFRPVIIYCIVQLPL